VVADVVGQALKPKKATSKQESAQPSKPLHLITGRWCILT
jgi:hypothetical protein